MSFTEFRPVLGSTSGEPFLIPVKPTASGFTLHDHLLNYRQKDQPYMEKHL
jgi:hypothetical protein